MTVNLAVVSVQRQAHSELWHILARALQRPRSPELLTAMREHLAADLRDLFRQLQLPACDALAQQLPAQIASIGGPTELLAIYSRLFLVPPGAVSLCIGRYLPRAVTGESALYLRRLMAQNGVAAAPGTGGADDHLVTLLEYLAWRCEGTQGSTDTAMDVQELRLRFLLPAVAAMVEKTSQREIEFSCPQVYSLLLRVLHSALSDPAQRLFSSPVTHPSAGVVASASPVASSMASCRRCGAAIASFTDLAVMRDRLRAAGLPTEHLTLCIDCRAAPSRQ